MSQEQQGPTSAGWYQDGTGTQRWWDGTQWSNPAPTPGIRPRTQFIQNPVLRYLYLAGGVGVLIGTFGLAAPDCPGAVEEALDSERAGGFIGALELSRGRPEFDGLCAGCGES